jgi:hypothetical protein
MNKLIIGLLVVAAGAGAFFLLRKKKETSVTNSINKEWIIGKWKPDSVNDTNFSRFQFDFQKNGNVVRSFNDYGKADTSHYQLNKGNELVWSGWTPSEKEKATDTTGKLYLVTKLTLDTLQIQAPDSSSVLFTKVK